MIPSDMGDYLCGGSFDYHGTRASKVHLKGGHICAMRIRQAFCGPGCFKTSHGRYCPMGIFPSHESGGFALHGWCITYTMLCGNLCIAISRHFTSLLQASNRGGLHRPRHSDLRPYPARPTAHILYRIRIDSNTRNLSIASPTPSNLPGDDIPRLRVPQLGKSHWSLGIDIQEKK